MVDWHGSLVGDNSRKHVEWGDGGEEGKGEGSRGIGCDGRSHLKTSIVDDDTGLLNSGDNTTNSNTNKATDKDDGNAYQSVNKNVTDIATDNAGNTKQNGNETFKLREQLIAHRQSY